MTNLEIAEILRDIAAAYRLKDEAKNKFKIIAYERAADAVEHAASELKDLWDEGKLKEVPGIGESIAEHLDELFRTGRSKHFDELMKGINPAVFELMKIPGIGVKRAARLVNELKIESIEELKKAALENRIAGLEGFGEDSQSSILKSVGDVKKDKKRMLLPYATEIANDIIEWIKKDKSVVAVDPLGSLRRKVSTIGDVDIAAASDKPQETIEHFTKYPHASRVLEKGVRSAAIILPSGAQVDILVGEPATYGSILQHFTGSKHHNVALREYALKKGVSLSDYGIYTKPGEQKSLKKIATEEEFYKFLGMDWIPPEIREDTGEIQAALDHKLPSLVELKDIKADLQIHSSFDIETSHDLGLSSMEEIIDKANELNYEYIAFTEHNPSKSKHSEGQIIEILKRKREKVDKINYSFVKSAKFSVKKVFNSLEIDILPDGKLPVPAEGLATLDFALISVHSSFRLARSEMTKRVLTAMDYPKVKIFAHPTARKLNEREGIDLDWEKIFEKCLAKNIWVEINADPMRLDLPDNLVHDAVAKGVKLTLGTDSHHKDSMNNMEYGVYVARRGWCQTSDIINTHNLEEFEKSLEGHGPEQGRGGDK